MGKSSCIISSQIMEKYKLKLTKNVISWAEVQQISSKLLNRCYNVIYNVKGIFALKQDNYIL